MSSEQSELAAYLAAIRALLAQSRLTQEEVDRKIAFEHLDQRMHALKQQIELIRATLEPKSSRQARHFSHLHETALALIAHHVAAPEISDEQLEQEREAIHETLTEVLNESTLELTTLATLDEQADRLIELIEVHPALQSKTHSHVQALKHQVAALHQAQHTPEHSDFFAQHCHALAEANQHMHHLVHRAIELLAELREEEHNRHELEELEMKLQESKEDAEAQLDAIKEQLERVQHQTQ